jgi:cysteine desulfurase / selenocysteine lyase
MVATALADRSGYSTLRESAYLNQASLGLIGQRAVEAMHAMLDEVARHGNLHMSDEQEVAFLADLRGRAAELLSVDGRRVALVSSASELLTQAPFLLSPPAGSKVIAVATDFPAITRPWLRLETTGRCVIDFVADRPDSDLTTDVIARIDAETSVVAIGWVQFATGTVIDVPRLRAATDQVGARLLLDVTQGAGALSADASVWRPDMLVSSGYKWLGGHGGVAFGVLAEDLVSEIPPLPGWFGAADPFGFDATHLSVAPDARRFTQSTMSYISVTGLTAAIDELLQIGVGEVAQHAARLADLLVKAVEPLGWRPYRPLDDPAASPHIVALTHPARPAADVANRLRRRGIVCSSRGDRLRVSLALYNDHTDITALADALA